MFPSPHLIDSEAPIPDPHAPSPFEDTTAGGKTSGTAIVSTTSIAVIKIAEKNLLVIGRFFHPMI